MDAPETNGASRLDSRDRPDGHSHGQAALLLVESLMHALMAKRVISREDFVETVEGAAEVELELVLAEASSPPDATGSFLYPLADAFRKELGR
jgi:hypothetical protein